MEKISIIVPIYGVETFLKQSVESIRSQSYSNLEIILVDDGSPDSCGSICDEFAHIDSRIQVIHQENGGLSDARNAGLSVATGEYVAFVDSDDWIAPEFIQSMLEACKKEQCEIAICRYSNVNCNGKLNQSKEQGTNKNYTIYENNDLLLSMYEDYNIDCTCFTVTWNKLYRKSLWQGIVFPKGRIHEDEATTYLLLDKVKKAVFLEDSLYYYRQTPGSIMQDSFQYKRLDWIKALEERISYFIHNGNNQVVAASMKAYADASITFFQRLKKEVPHSNKEQKQLKKHVKDTLKTIKKYGKLPIRTRLGYYIFLVSPALFFRLLGEV